MDLFRCNQRAETGLDAQTFYREPRKTFVLEPRGDMTGGDEPRPWRIRLAQPDVGEEELDAISRVFKSGTLTNGPETAAFEREFADLQHVSHAIAVANGTLALSAIYLALGIGPTDEVIVPSLTFISTATSVLHVGATPVFADIDPETFNLDPNDVLKRVTARTKAIVAVHYGGQSADMAQLTQIGEEAGIPVIEDAAEAHGASYRGRPVGGLGLAGMFSFTPTKNMTTGEGGIVTTDDGQLASRLRLIRNHGQTSLYRHDVLGWNWRMTEMQAAMGRCQVRKLPGILERKRSNADLLAELLGDLQGITLPVVRTDRDHTYMLYTLILDNQRDNVLEALQTAGIEARVYFPPAHQQPVFRSVATHLPVTEAFADRLLSVPFHAKVSPSDFAEIAAIIGKTVANSRANV